MWVNNHITGLENLCQYNWVNMGKVKNNSLTKIYSRHFCFVNSLTNYTSFNTFWSGCLVVQWFAQNDEGFTGCIKHRFKAHTFNQIFEDLF